MGWVRWYEDVTDDKKLIRAARDLQMPFCWVVGAWGLILLLARASPVRGTLLVATGQPLTAAEIAETFRETLPVTNRVLHAFVDVEMLGLDGPSYVVVNYGRRQFESDGSSTERVRKHRAKGRGETFQKRFSETPHSIAEQSIPEGAAAPAPARAREGDPASDDPPAPRETRVPILIVYRDLTGRDPSSKDRRTSEELMSRPDWDVDLALAAMKLCHKRAVASGESPRSVGYYAPAVIEALELGRMPTPARGRRDGTGGSKTGATDRYGL